MCVRYWNGLCWFCYFLPAIIHIYIYVIRITKTLAQCSGWIHKHTHTPNWLRHGASMVTNGSVYNMVSFWFIIFPVQPFIECKHLSDVNNKHFCVLFHGFASLLPAKNEWPLPFALCLSVSHSFALFFSFTASPRPTFAGEKFCQTKCHCCCLITEIIYWIKWKLAISLN